MKPLPDLGPLSQDDLEAVAADLETGRLDLPVDVVDMGHRVGPVDVAAIVRGLNALHAEGFSGRQAAVVLRLVARERDHARAIRDRLQLVWTGPETPGAGSRDTSVVVPELFKAARESVLISCFAIHQGSRVFQALAERLDAGTGLRVRLFVNVHADPAVPSTGDVIDRFATRFRERDWPGKRLPEIYYDPRSLARLSGERAVLHAKCIVVDARRSFVTSANFTEAAQQRNIEAGVLVEDALFAQALVGQFESLVTRGVLRRVPGLS